MALPLFYNSHSNNRIDRFRLLRFEFNVTIKSVVANYQSCRNFLNWPLLSKMVVFHLNDRLIEYRTKVSPRTYSGIEESSNHTDLSYYGP